MQMQLGSDIEIPDGLLAENTLLREKPRLGFERTETTVHQASIRLNYLNGNRVSSTVAFEGRPVSLMAQQQNNGKGQQNQTDSSGHPINKDAIANYADQHAEKGSLGKCAAYCRRAFEAGGVDTSGHPLDAKDWGPTLLKNGAVVVSPDGYTPQKADTAVFAGSDAHPHGHIAVYDGKQWVSDFKQRNMSPYRTAAPPVTIYRFPDN